MEIDRDALLEVFRDESEEQLAVLEASLVALEQRPQDPELVAELFRVAHTVKGSARCLALAEVADFSHGFEDLLEQVRSGAVPVTPKLVTLLLRAGDALRGLVADAVSQRAGMGREAQTLLRSLKRRAREARGAGRDVPPAAAPALDADEGPLTETRAAEVRSLRVNLDRLDRMLGLTGEVAVAWGRLKPAVDAGGAGPDAVDAAAALDRLLVELQEQVLKARMVPLGPLFRTQVRAVRDLALGRDKQARVVLAGEDIEADTRVVDVLRDALTHMVRNAVDHGLEPPARRRGQGKDPVGTLALRARHEAGHLVVVVSDDGAGVDRERLLRRGRELGLVGEEEPAEADLLRLMFAPNVTTAEAVTELSGRGVGMDLVRRSIERARGTVTVASRPGEGTRFTIRLPLTLLVVPGLLVAADEERYVIPVDAVTECADLPEAEGRAAGEAGIMNFRGEALPYLRLRRLFRLDGAAPVRESVVLVQHQRGRAGLVVDQIVGEVQAVVRPLAGPLRGVPGFSGATILGSGRVGLFLDVPALVEVAARRHAGPTGSGAARDTDGPTSDPRRPGDSGGTATAGVR